MIPTRRRSRIPAALTLATALVAAAPTWAKKAKVDLPEKVTYAEHVGTLLHDNCVSCHRPGDIAPMSLLTYDEARPWAKSIAKAVTDGTMPPWHANPDHGAFRNDRSLSAREKALLARWVKQGAPAGDLSQAPAPPEFEESWRLGEPDLVVTFDSVDLPADGPDVFRDLIADPGHTEDRWIRAIEVLPGDRKVVHHVIIYAGNGNEEPSSGWLGAWAAGMDPMTFPKGTAKLLQKGHVLVADMHYHPSGEPATDATKIGIHFYDGEPEKELINLWVQNASFKIPAGASDHEVRSSHTFTQDSTIHALLPHMHYRGKDFTYTATFPDGTSQTLLQVDSYDFNWQTNYELESPLVVPAGTKINCVAHYDNSEDNPYNPDPTRDVTFGNESFDEMMIGFVDYVVNDGRSPETVEQRLTRIRTELLARDGVVFDVTVHDPDGSIPSVLHLPVSGDGQWYVPINGHVFEGAVAGIEREGSELRAKYDAPMGMLDVLATLSESRIEGEVSLGDQKLTFSGDAAKP